MNAIDEYARAWDTLTAETFVGLLAEDVTLSSAYHFDDLKGRERVADYITGKLETISKSGA